MPTKSASSSLLVCVCHSVVYRTHRRTGFQSKQLIVEAGLNLGDVDVYPSIDVTIDGADEYAAQYRLCSTDSS